MRECWNWQTGTFEVRVSSTYGFKSRLAHQFKSGLIPRFLGFKPFFLFFDNRYHGIKAAKYTPKPHKKHKIQHEIQHGKLRIFLGFELLSASGTTRAGNKKSPGNSRIKPECPRLFLKLDKSYVPAFTADAAFNACYCGSRYL